MSKLTSTQMVELANIKSQGYEGKNTRSTANAKWENIVNLDLQEGDVIAVENAIINIRGISSDSTVEILGEDNEHNLSDSKVGIRCSAYVNDNATNSVALPLVCANRQIIFPVIYGDSDVVNYPTLDSLLNTGGDNISWKSLDFSDAMDDAPYNAGEPDTSGDNFQFTYHEGTAPNSPFGNSLYTYYTENAKNGEWNSISGHKYTVMDPNYMGPYRSDTNGNFNSGEDDCKPMYLDLKIDVNGPLYESPSTIADTINQQLNTTNVYGDNETNPIVYTGKKQAVQLPALSGPLLKVKEVNGTKQDKGDKQKLWGNIAVRDMKKWQGVHALMRTDIAFDYNISFNDPTALKKLYQPCFLMPNGAIDNQVYYPRTTKTFKYTIAGLREGGTYDDTADIYYTTLPQYYVFTTNMKYNEDNIKRIQTYMRNTEKYDGVLKDGADDIENWRSHWDIGFSDHGGHGKTKHMYYAAHGNFYLDRFFPPAPAFQNWTQYSNSFPYFPYKSEVDVLSTSRSEVPNVGYTQMVVQGDTIPDPLDPSNLIMEGLFNISAIKEDVHHFKDNKNGDASIAFYSRYDSNWKNKVNTQNLDNISFENDSLSKQYNVGCYPVKMKSHSGPDTTYDLTDTYWVGCCKNVPERVQGIFPCPDLSNLYKIGEGHDDDHKKHGGYSFYIWGEFTEQWEAQDDIYIYSFKNQNRPDGRDEVNGLNYDGTDVIELNTNGNTFVIDARILRGG